MHTPNEQQQQRTALKHCRRIKSTYTKCRRELPQGDSYTHIPLKLWEAIETMLNDDTISENTDTSKG